MELRKATASQLKSHIFDDNSEWNNLIIKNIYKLPWPGRRDYFSHVFVSAAILLILIEPKGNNKKSLYVQHEHT